jgi:UDP-3-O-[3-hydroxymyristoyl] glucosamine N-acyltransferase
MTITSGRVVVENNVELELCTTIDKGVQEIQHW